ncbi:MAG: PLP-dependent transferase, partial [Henriciella sp.]
MKDKTKLIHRHGDRHRFNTVNPPIERASTLLISTRETLQGKSTVYGRMGLSVHRELEAAMCDLESADYAFLTSNGLQACALASAALVKAGDHVL